MAALYLQEAPLHPRILPGMFPRRGYPPKVSNASVHGVFFTSGSLTYRLAHVASRSLLRGAALAWATPTAV